MCPMVDPTPVKNMKTQGMTTDKTRSFHHAKAQSCALNKVIGDANNENTELFAVMKEEAQV